MQHSFHKYIHNTHINKYIYIYIYTHKFEAAKSLSANPAK